MTPLKSKLVGLANVIALAFAPACFAEPVTIDVKFKLTDIDYKPLPHVPVRLVIGSDKNWQSADSGYRFVTDDKGEAKLTVQAAFDKRLKKTPTNYIDSLFSLPAPRDHLFIGADLDYRNLHALYMVDLIVVPDATMQDNFVLYLQDSDGRFSKKMDTRDYALVRPDLKGYVLQGPGFQPADFLLSPDQSDSTHKRWKLSLAFKESAPPVKYDPPASK